MAKKKTRKDPEKGHFKYSSELTGLIIILISIIGLGGYGIIGEVIRGFGLFLVGSWFQLLLASLFLVGGYMTLKREMPNFFSIRMIGLYLIFISILLWSHLNYVLKLDINGVEIFKATIDNFMISLKVVSNIDGGGIIGAFFSW